MFKYLKILPDISKWDIHNVSDISYLFAECSSLKSLPDISNWNTSNINIMNGVFYECSNLKLLPDISKWNINIYSFSQKNSKSIHVWTLPHGYIFLFGINCFFCMNPC